MQVEDYELVKRKHFVAGNQYKDKFQNLIFLPIAFIRLEEGSGMRFGENVTLADFCRYYDDISASMDSEEHFEARGWIASELR